MGRRLSRELAGCEGHQADGPWPRVSVVLPTHGRPELVRDALQGVLGQTYSGDIECLVVHDREPVDLALESMSRRRRLVRVLPNQHRSGLAGARNTGVDHASGDLVATCDDDDRWHPRKLQLQVCCLQRRPELLVVGCGLRLVSPEGAAVQWVGRFDTVERATLLHNRVKELHSSSLLMWRDAYAKAGRYDERLPHGYGEDYDWVLRASRVGRIGIVREVLVDIRRGQSYYAGRCEDTLDGLEALMRKHPEIRGSRRGHARMLGQMALMRSCLGQRRAAFRDSLHALTRWPLSPYPLLALVHVVSGVDVATVRRASAWFGRELV